MCVTGLYQRNSIYVSSNASSQTSLLICEIYTQLLVENKGCCVY